MVILNPFKGFLRKPYSKTWFVCEEISAGSPQLSGSPRPARGGFVLFLGDELWGFAELGQSRTPLTPALKPQGWRFLRGIIQQEGRRENFIKGRETTQTSL